MAKAYPLLAVEDLEFGKKRGNSYPLAPVRIHVAGNA